MNQKKYRRCMGALNRFKIVPRDQFKTWTDERYAAYVKAKRTELASLEATAARYRA